MKYKEKAKKKEEELIKDLIKIRNAIRKKVQAIRTGRVEIESQLERTFKPVTTSLKALTPNVKQELRDIDFSLKKEDIIETPKDIKLKKEFTSTPLKSKEFSSIADYESFGTPTHSKTLVEKNVLNLSTSLFDRYTRYHIENNPKIDKVYGPYIDNDVWKIGNSEIEIKEDELIIGGKEYKITMGLCELLFMKEPLESIYTKDDISNYQSILLQTDVYRRGYESQRQIKGSRSSKYINIISKLIKPTEGSGMMKLPKEQIDYLYWDDPNELVHRLRLLVASQEAGNNSHSNEMISIIEELRKAEVLE